MFSRATTLLVDERSEVRELDFRTSSDGQMRVVLLWDPADPGQVLLEAHDSETSSHVSMIIPGRDATEAFWHPFSYAESAVGGLRQPA